MKGVLVRLLFMLLTKEHIAQYRTGVKEVLFEALWPTACLGCNSPQVLLCNQCRKNLGYIDSYAACPVCGAPYGRVQCCECNPVMLDAFGLKAVPYDTCKSAVLFDGVASRLVTLYKDRGEQRLAPLIAAIMAAYLSPHDTLNRHMHPAALAYIPASAKAVHARGFDHIRLIAQHLSERSGLSLIDLFERPKAKDQRALTRRMRYENMKGRFILKPGVGMPNSVLLIDDVYTTGSTLISASETLITHGVEHVHCLTFARVP